MKYDRSSLIPGEVAELKITDSHERTERFKVCVEQRVVMAGRHHRWLPGFVWYGWITDIDACRRVTQEATSEVSRTDRMNRWSTMIEAALCSVNEECDLDGGFYTEPKAFWSLSRQSVYLMISNADIIEASTEPLGVLPVTWNEERGSCVPNDAAYDLIDMFGQAEYDALEKRTFGEGHRIGHVFQDEKLPLSMVYLLSRQPR